MAGILQSQFPLKTKALQQMEKSIGTSTVFIFYQKQEKYKEETRDSPRAGEERSPSHNTIREEPSNHEDLKHLTKASHLLVTIQIGK